jgi:hypothetical protein
MRANERFRHQGLDFWAAVKLVSQEVGYTSKRTKTIRVPTMDEIVGVLEKRGLRKDKMLSKQGVMLHGQLVLDYFQHRADLLNTQVQHSLMNLEEAQALYAEIREKHPPTWPVPMNKQKGEKRQPLILTGMVNALLEAHLQGKPCAYSPSELITFVSDGHVHRTLSRRVDGAFPGTTEPIAMWEIKEYYYTKTFGSRVADGVYESLLDGLELREVRESLNRSVDHVLVVDDHFTWWVKGRSYLCRIIDMLHMGIVSEAIFGREVLERIPILANEWANNEALLTRPDF